MVSPHFCAALYRLLLKMLPAVVKKVAAVYVVLKNL